MKNQEFNNSAQKSSTLKQSIKKNSFGSMINQTVNLNSNASLSQKDAPFLFTKQPAQKLQSQMSDLPAINSNSINNFINRPYSEDTQNSTNKIEGKKTNFNRKTTIQQKLNQQQQMQQQTSSYTFPNKQQQQQPQSFQKLRSQVGSATSTLSNLGETQNSEKGNEEQDRQLRSGFVEKFMSQIKNPMTKQPDVDSQSLLMSLDHNSLKANKFQQPALNILQKQTLNSYKQSNSQQNLQYNDDEQEEEEEIEQINRDDTYLYSDESSNSPVKSKFQLSSSDASNGNLTNGKNTNLIQQKQGQKQNNNGQDDKGSINMKDTTKANFSKRDKQYEEEDQDQEEKKDQKSDFQQSNQQNDQEKHTKTIRERFSLPEKSKENQPQSIKEINRTLSQNDQQLAATSSNFNNGQQESDQSKGEAIQQKIVKWKSGDFIGAGSFGQVFTAMNCNTGEIFVVKKIMVHSQPKLDKEFLDDQEKELKIMQRLSHKHIIQYKGHERQSDCLCIFLEYMSEGNIDQMLKKFGALEEQTIKVYARQILSGIQYLHSEKVIHKDIKGANILVGSDGIVKLSDFGCAKQLELTLNSNKEMNKTLKGSVPWMSPEIVTQTKYDTKADIWSFGCTILEMAQAAAPWSNYQFDNPIAAIMKIGLSDEIPKIPDNISTELSDFIKKCLQRDPLQRPTAIELLNDSFLAEI